LTYLGYFDQARVRREEALAQARQRGHAHTLVMVIGISLDTKLHVRSDPTTLWQQMEEMMALCSEHGFPYYEAGALAVRGRCLFALGRTEEALRDLTDALAKYRATGAVTVAPEYLTFLAETLGKAGRPTEGLQQLDEAARLIEVTEERWSEADINRVRGELLIIAG
jgi:tetratricopeptide (TPR) repeat protein